ncbi:MAG: hypothetical protein JXR86_00960 [Spirochaetales bacterium]|nr:hypothetical protein [Spirochaetales bacterium]
MGDCEFINKCPFFNGQLANMPDQVEELKEKYCRKNNLNCARYMVANSLGADKMLPDLFPHEKERAYMHIAQNG